jgi:hypothetical protein
VTFGAAAPYLLRMKRAALAVTLVALAAGCGSSHAAQHATRLTLTANSGMVGEAVFHLDCAPAGGDVADPAAACAALQRDPKLVTSPEGFMCWGDGWNVTISGRLVGNLVHERFATCWTRQSRTLAKLGLAPSGRGEANFFQRHFVRRTILYPRLPLRP